MPTIEDAKNLAAEAHEGQFDKAGRPYFEHVAAVARHTVDLISLYGQGLTYEEMDAATMAAFLHDVVEDTPLTFEDLAAKGFAPAVIETVRLLTRDRSTGLSYMDWIRSIARSGNRAALLVKLADNMHNSDPARIAALDEHEQGIADRYRRSMDILRKALT